MAISSTQYIDLLFKSLSGVAKTDLPTNKSASNEAIASPILNRGDQTWTESGLIPSTATSVAGVVQAYVGTGRAVATADNTSQAVGGVFPSWKTNLTNWIPPQFDTANITNTYRVKIYYGASGLSDPAASGGTQIFADGSGGTGEWYFDYASGVLNFIGGTIPSGMTGSSVIYVYGYRYVGKVGVNNLPAITVSGTSTFSAINALSGAFTATTISTNTTTGALVVSGGLGVGGSAFIGGNLTVSGTLNATINGTITTATNIANGTAGQLVYQSSPGVTDFAGPGTAGQLLVSGGTSAPTYTNTGSIYVGYAVNSEKWLTPRTITLAGDLGGSVNIDGSGNVTLTATIQADSIALGTDTTGIYVASGAVSGFGLSGSANTEGSTFTVTSNATSTNDANTIVFRDASGNFSAGTITASTFSGTLGTGGAQSISTNALSLSGYADNTGILYFSNGTGLVASNSASFAWDNTAGVLRVKTLTSATSTSTGALVVNGGVGIGGNLYVGGEIVANKLTIQLTTITTTLVQTDDIIQTLNTTDAVSTNSGALQIAGGAGIGGNLYVGGTIVGAVTGVVTTATNLAGGTAGQTPYQTAAGVTSFYGPGTAGQLLVSGGTNGPAYTNTSSIYVGYAVNAEKWLTPRTITFTGDTTGTFTIDGSANVTNVNLTIQPDSVTLGADTTGIYVASAAVSGFGLSGSANTEGSTFTVTSNATSTNDANTIVFRDASGNFSVGTITGLITTATNIAGGTAGQIHYQSAPGVTAFVSTATSGQILVSGGTGAPSYATTGSIYVGQAVNADKLTVARTITLDGDLGGSITFDGSTNVTLTATVQANSIELGTDTTGNYVATGATSGFGISGSTTGENATFTVNSNATSSNAISTLVFRDGSGNFSAGTITAALTGNATSADKWSTARTITLSGDLGGDVTFDGSGNAILTATIQADSVALGSDTTGNYVASGGTTGFGLSGSANSETATFTVNINSTSSNTTSTVVYRDGSGNFSANVVTADLVGTASSANDLTGGAAGSLPYQTGAGVTVFLPLGLDGKILQVSTATNAPVWGDIDGGTY